MSENTSWSTSTHENASIVRTLFDLMFSQKFMSECRCVSVCSYTRISVFVWERNQLILFSLLNVPVLVCSTARAYLTCTGSISFHGIGWSIKRWRKKWRKHARKNEDDIAERWKLGTWTTPTWCLFLQKNFFPVMIYVADMAILLSNFYYFDHNQISWKLAQR